MCRCSKISTPDTEARTEEEVCDEQADYLELLGGLCGLGCGRVCPESASQCYVHGSPTDTAPAHAYAAISDSHVSSSHTDTSAFDASTDRASRFAQPDPFARDGGRRYACECRDRGAVGGTDATGRAW